MILAYYLVVGTNGSNPRRQVALVGSTEFHRSVQDLQSWLDAMQDDLRRVQPVDSGVADGAALSRKHAVLKVCSDSPI